MSAYAQSYQLQRSRRSREIALPSDPDRERNLIGVALLSETYRPQIIALPSSAFHHPTYRVLHSTMRALETERTPIDAVTITARMRADGNGDLLEAFGGDVAVAALPSCVSTLENVDYHVKALLDDEARRNLHAVTRKCSIELVSDPSVDPHQIVERLVHDAQAATATVPDLKTEITSPAARALTLGGSLRRLTTSIPSLNTATRGGLPTKKVIVMGGAPGAGKTTLSVQLAWEWASQGVPVGILAADEEADELLIRIGQQQGIPREQLEGGDPESRRALAEDLEVHPDFILVDSDETPATVETVSAELSRRAGGRSSVLIVDSIQTVRVNGIELADGPRARIDRVMAALKRAAKNDGHLVIATCELARGAYRSQDATQRIDDLAAFKESGGIEYGASMALVLRSVAGDGGLVDVSMPKNRLGRKTPFRLSQDSTKAKYSEVELPADGQPSQVERIKDRVLDALKKTAEPFKSKNAIARGIEGNKKVTLKAVDELVDEGRVSMIDGVYHLGSGTGSGTAAPVLRFHGSTPFRGNREPEPVPGKETDDAE